MNETSSGEALWADLVNRDALSEREQSAFISAEINADDTAVERGFQPMSEEWFDIFELTYNEAYDNWRPEDVQGW